MTPAKDAENVNSAETLDSAGCRDSAGMENFAVRNIRQRLGWLSAELT